MKHAVSPEPPISLKAWRTGRQFTQIQAAAYLGVGQGHYSNLETHRVYPNRHLAKTISEKTGIPLAAVLGVQ